MKDLIKKIASLVGIGTGILSVIFGFVTFGKSVGDTPDYASFNADYYTYQYRATRYVAGNLRSLAKIAKFAGGALLLIIGLALICFFLMQLLNACKDDGKCPFRLAEKKPAAPEEPAPVPEEPMPAEPDEAPAEDAAPPEE